MSSTFKLLVVAFWSISIHLLFPLDGLEELTFSKFKFVIKIELFSPVSLNNAPSKGVEDEYL